MADGFIPTPPTEIVDEKHWLTCRVLARWGGEFPFGYSLSVRWKNDAEFGSNLPIQSAISRSPQRRESP